MARRVKLHKAMRLAKRQCPGKVEGHVCGDRWRVVKVNPKETIRYGTMTCAVHGHVVEGKHATLVTSLRKGA